MGKYPKGNLCFEGVLRAWEGSADAETIGNAHSFARAYFATNFVFTYLTNGGAIWRNVSPRSYVLGDVPHVGDHFATGSVSGMLLAVFLDPSGRYDSTVTMHRWALRYALAVMLQGVAEVIGKTWIYAA